MAALVAMRGATMTQRSMVRQTVRWSILVCTSVGMVLLGRWWWCTAAACMLRWQVGVPHVRQRGFSMLLIVLSLHVAVGIRPFRWLTIWLIPKEPR